MSTDATTNATAPVPVPVPVPEPAAGAQAVIDGARQRIDELDARIIALVQDRMAVSAEVQQARIATGGPRLALARELEILARYRAAFGAQGTEVAMQLLELCRGRA